jgi:ketosteroid isomerase-like protein
MALSFINETLCGKMCVPALCGCLALMMLTAGCNQTPADTRAADAQTIKDLDTQWSKTAGAHDLDGTLSYYSDDATVLPANAPMVADKQAIRARWAAELVPGVDQSWQSNKVEVAASGDLAYDTGSYTMTMKDAQGKPVTDRGKYIEVWKKQADGKWKVVADIWNSDLPVAAPAPAKTN